nr:hypothetical protein [Rhizobium binae]
MRLKRLDPDFVAKERQYKRDHPEQVAAQNSRRRGQGKSSRRQPHSSRHPSNIPIAGQKMRRMRRSRKQIHVAHRSHHTPVEGWIELADQYPNLVPALQFGKTRFGSN